MDEGTLRLRDSQKRNEDTARTILLMGARNRGTGLIMLTGLAVADPVVCE
jgi:hypothetical protein